MNEKPKSKVKIRYERLEATRQQPAWLKLCISNITHMMYNPRSKDHMSRCSQHTRHVCTLCVKSLFSWYAQQHELAYTQWCHARQCALTCTQTCPCVQNAQERLPCNFQLWIQPFCWNECCLHISLINILRPNTLLCLGNLARLHHFRCLCLAHVCVWLQTQFLCFDFL